MSGPTHAELRDARYRLERAEADYLRRWGWKQTCEVPGSYWMWRRDFADYDARFDAWNKAHSDKAHKPTGVLTLPQNMALSMTERVLDERPEEGDDDD